MIEGDPVCLAYVPWPQMTCRESRPRRKAPGLYVRGKEPSERVLHTASALGRSWVEIAQYLRVQGQQKT